jgi:hypothetical protein
VARKAVAKRSGPRMNDVASSWLCMGVRDRCRPPKDTKREHMATRMAGPDVVAIVVEQRQSP